MIRTSVFVLAAACLALLLVSATTPAPVCAQVELTYNTFFPVTHAHTVLATEWAKEIEKRTKGAVKITMFAGGTLTPPEQCYNGVVKGISDVGMGVAAYNKGKFPLTEVLEVPLGHKNGLQMTRLMNAFYKKFQPKEWNETQVMYLHGYGPGQLHTKKPIRNLEDVKGLKIRCTGTSARIVSALGALPVAMPQTEVYDGLEKGVCEGLLSPPEVLKGWRFAEVTNDTTISKGAGYSMTFWVAMNKKKWQSLPQDVRKIIEQVNEEWIDKTGKAWDAMDAEGTEFAKSKGHQFIQLSSEEDERWRKAVLPVRSAFVVDAKKRGLPAEEALQFCLDWLTQNP